MLWLTKCFQLMPTETKPKAFDTGLSFLHSHGRKMKLPLLLFIVYLLRLKDCLCAPTGKDRISTHEDPKGNVWSLYLHGVPSACFHVLLALTVIYRREITAFRTPSSFTGRRSPGS